MDDNIIHQLMILEHLKATQNIRSLVAEGLKRIVDEEVNLEKKNLFQSAVDLLEFNKLITVHLGSDKTRN